MTIAEPPRSAVRGELARVTSQVVTHGEPHPGNIIRTPAGSA